MEKIFAFFYDIKDEKTRKREIERLAEAMEYFSLKESYLIILEAKEEIVFEDKKIIVLLMIEWLLQ